MATSRSGGATQRYTLGTRQADGAPVAVEEDTAALQAVVECRALEPECFRVDVLR